MKSPEFRNKALNIDDPEFVDKVDNIEDAKSYIAMLMFSNAELARLCVLSTLHLLVDESGRVVHTHEDPCPALTVLELSEQMGYTFQTGKHEWRIRDDNEKLN